MRLITTIRRQPGKRHYLWNANGDCKVNIRFPQRNLPGWHCMKRTFIQLIYGLACYSPMPQYSAYSFICAAADFSWPKLCWRMCVRVHVSSSAFHCLPFFVTKFDRLLCWNFNLFFSFFLQNCRLSFLTRPMTASVFYFRKHLPV